MISAVSCKFWIWCSDRLKAAQNVNSVITRRSRVKQTWLAFTYVTWPSFHDNALIGCCSDLCRNCVLRCCFHGHVLRTEVDWRLRGAAFRTPSNNCTTFVTAQTGSIAEVSTLLSHPRKHIREFNCDPCRLLRLSPNSYQSVRTVISNSVAIEPNTLTNRHSNDERQKEHPKAFLVLKHKDVLTVTCQDLFSRVGW